MMVHAEVVIRIYKHLLDNGVQVWLTGGWGIDALLGEETRPHKDLDVIMSLDDVVRMCEIMASQGYRLKDLWPENRWTTDVKNNVTATAFVLADSDGHEFDVHAMCLDDRGNGIPAWQEVEGFIFEKKDLSGEGKIAGFPVRCISPEKQMQCHTGYELPDKQSSDLELLNKKFGIEYPNEVQCLAKQVNEGKKCT